MSGLVHRVTTRNETHKLAKMEDCDPGCRNSQDEDSLKIEGKVKVQKHITEIDQNVSRRQAPEDILVEKDVKINEEGEDSHMTILGRSLEEVKILQQNDPDIGPIIDWKLKSSERPVGELLLKHSPATRNLWLAWELLVIKDGILYRRSPTEGAECLILPHKLQSEVLDVTHGSVLGGHLGQKKTFGRLVKKYYWFQMKNAVKNWVQKCTICNSNIRAHRKARGPLGKMCVGAP